MWGTVGRRPASHPVMTSPGRSRTVHLAAALAALVAVAGCSSSSSNDSSGSAAGGRANAPSGQQAGWDCPGGVCDWSVEPVVSPIDGKAPPTTASYRVLGDPAASALGPGSGAVELDVDADPTSLAGEEAQFLADNPAARFRPVMTGRPVVLEVVDAVGRPILGAIVSVRSNGQTVAIARTHADGRALAIVPPGATEPLTVLASTSLASRDQPLPPGESQVRVTLDAPTGAQPPAVDVVFVLDATASLADELEGLKADIGGVVDRLGSLAGSPEVRYGLTAFRDADEQFLTRTFNLTADADRFRAALDEVQATGGGDTPEALEQGLADAIRLPNWGDDRSIKLIFVLSDAPPHADDRESEPPYPTSIAEANEAGIMIVPIAARGLDDTGAFVYRQLARATLGSFIALAGPTVANGAELPVAPMAPDALGTVISSVVERQVARLVGG